MRKDTVGIEVGKNLCSRRITGPVKFTSKDAVRNADLVIWNWTVRATVSVRTVTGHRLRVACHRGSPCRWRQLKRLWKPDGHVIPDKSSELWTCSRTTST